MLQNKIEEVLNQFSESEKKREDEERKEKELAEEKAKEEREKEEESKFSERFGKHFSESAKDYDARLCQLEESLGKVVEMMEKHSKK